MQLETFRGPDLRSVMAWVHRSLGDDAMIVRTNVLKRDSGPIYEVFASTPEKLKEYRRDLSQGPVAPHVQALRGTRPYVIALVGPPGAGKTTATMKMALHPRGVGTGRVGLITLDTYRVGAVEEFQTYAEIAALRSEVLYHAREAEAALQRLADHEVVLVDTPGRTADGTGWVETLEALKPDEVHLVLPAGLRKEVAVSLHRRLHRVGVTHALFTKLDEVPGDAGLAELAETVGLPTRWIGDGYEVPGELALATSRIFRSLGSRLEVA